MSTQQIFCCSKAKVAHQIIAPRDSGSKLLDFVTDVLDGKLPSRPRFLFYMEDYEVGDVLFSVTTTESAIAHSSTEFFCNFHVMGVEEAPSILVVTSPKEVIREDFKLDKDSVVMLTCEDHVDIYITVKVLQKR